jgi:hypothetical protein
MMLARILPARVGFDIRTFECPKCDHVHEVMVETSAFGQPFTPTAQSNDCAECRTPTRQPRLG